MKKPGGKEEDLSKFLVNLQADLLLANVTGNAVFKALVEGTEVEISIKTERKG